MAQIAVTILDPSNNRSAHLVETRLPIRDLIPPIVTQLKLPERATYQLFRLGSENALPAEKSLAENGVPAGAELQLKPVHNQILKAILDKLYEEAQGYIEEQAWELAKAKLEELFRLDPAYPDPLGLERAVASQVGALRTVPPTERITSRSQSTPRGRIPLSSTSTTVTPPPASLSGSGGGGAYQLSSAGAKGSGMSCVGIVLMVVGVIIVGSIALAGAYVFLPGILQDLAASLNIPFLGSVRLGTGDVQVTLRWEGDVDLDLHVIDPNGERIWFENPEAASGGILDVDANGLCEGISQPVENIYWPTGEAPSGSYEVHVVYYQDCDNVDPVDYEVTITLDGDVVDVINAQMTSVGEEHPVTNFDYQGETLSD